jgi:hypothetical protein
LNLSVLICELLDKKSFVFPPESAWLIKKLLFLDSLIVAIGRRRHHHHRLFNLPSFLFGRN